MKTKTILAAIILAAFSATAQNCKYITNEVDKFTGKYTKLTKPENVISTFYTSGDFSIKKIDTTYFFIFDYVLSSYSNFEPYSINQGAQIIFLLEDGKTITLNSDDNIKGNNKTVFSLPPVYCCYLLNASYTVTKKDIQTLLNSKVKSIRFYRTESNGKQDYIDNDIKKKNQDDIQNLIKCIL